MDGWGKLYKIQFKNEEVLYSGRMVEVPNYLESLEQGELVPQVCLFFMFGDTTFYPVEYIMQIWWRGGWMDILGKTRDSEESSSIQVIWKCESSYL